MASRLTRLERLFDRIPEVPCTGACGPRVCRDLTVSELEDTLLEVRASVQIDQVDGACTLFDPATGACGSHRWRPLICRLYGAMEAFPCAFGCKPERWFSVDEAVELLNDIKALSPAGDRWRRVGAEPDPAVTAALLQGLIASRE